MDSLKMQSPNLVDANVEKIAALFPNCITEDRDENGTVKRVVDFDLLRQELSASLVEGPRERYTLNWPGKSEAILTANAPIAKTLRPCKEESVDFDNTRNIYIEGDNLDALKLLQETYLNRVKMIYIDPPYNTGNDFIYDDDFAEEFEAYKLRTNQQDGLGNKLIANTEANGRFHSDWLSMILCRLKLAWNLLKDDGVIFISIDDNEQANLKRICDEIFGENNFISKIIHKNNALKNQSKFIGTSTEYVFVYAKNIELLKTKGDWKEKKVGASDICKFVTDCFSAGKSLAETLELVKELYARPKYSHLSRWNKIDDKGVFMDDNLSREGGPKNYTITNPLTLKECPIPPRGWGKSYEELLRLQKEGLIWYGDGSTPPRVKSYLTPETLAVPDNYKYFDTSKDKKLIDDLFSGRVFEYPKSLDLVKNLIEIANCNNEMVLDFFSGSATTAHAVMQLNSEDNGNRKFIMVQLPEPCDEKSEAYKAGYKTIAEIGKERIRRAGKKIKEENPAAQNLDIGFRVFKVDTSNMKDVYYTPDELKQDNLELFKDHIKSDRSPEDLLFQVFIDWGLDLTLPISKESIDGKTVFLVDTNALIACFDAGINEELVKKLAAHKPLRAVFRDDAFGSDSVKINVEQIFKSLSPVTEVKSI